MAETLTEFDKEVIRTRSQLKDMMDFGFREFVAKRRIEVPIPVFGNHLLTPEEKGKIRSFIFQAIDELEPLELLVIRRMFYKTMGVKAKEIPALA